MKCIDLSFRLTIPILFLLFSVDVFSQLRKDQSEHKVSGVFEKVNGESTMINVEGDTLESVFISREMAAGRYEVRLEKLSTSVFKVVDHKIFVRFEKPPNKSFDTNGMLIIDGKGNMFYLESDFFNRRGLPCNSFERDSNGNDKLLPHRKKY